MVDGLCNNYDSGAATVSDGENDEDPSHGSQSENDRAGRYWLVKVMPFYRECRMTTMMMNLRMKRPAQK